MGEKLVYILAKLRAYLEGFGTGLFVLWSVLFLAVFATSMCGPVLPYLVQDFIVEEAAVVAIIGYLSSVRNLSNTIASSASGILADKVGKRNVIFASLCLSPVPFLLYFFSNSFLWLFVAAIFLGVVHGFSSSPSKALIADLTPKTSMATAFAFFNLSWMLAEIPAPILGGFLSDAFNMRFPFIVAFGISVIAFLLFLKGFSGMKDVSATKLSCQTGSIVYSERQRSYMRVLVVFCMVGLLLGFGDGILMPIMTAFLLFRLGISSIEMGITFSIAFGLLMALSQIPGAKITDRFGKKPIILVSILVATPMIVLLPLTVNIVQFVFVLGLNNFIGYLWSPALSAWVADNIGVERRGKAFGFTSAAYGTGTIVGPAIGGVLWSVFQPNIVLPFIIATIPFFLIIPLIVMLKE